MQVGPPLAALPQIRNVECGAISAFVVGSCFGELHIVAHILIHDLDTQPADPGAEAADNVALHRKGHCVYRRIDRTRRLGIDHAGWFQAMLLLKLGNRLMSTLAEKGLAALGIGNRNAHNRQFVMQQRDVIAAQIQLQVSALQVHNVPHLAAAIFISLPAMRFVASSSGCV